MGSEHRYINIKSSLEAIIYGNMVPETCIKKIVLPYLMEVLGENVPCLIKHKFDDKSIFNNYYTQLDFN